LVLLLLLIPFFFHDPLTTEIYTLSLHDALPIYEHPHQDEREADPVGRTGSPGRGLLGEEVAALPAARGALAHPVAAARAGLLRQDRKSTRLNSSHVSISYAVFCLKKKKT